MKIIANRAACVGHARRAAVAEDLSDLDERGYIANSKDVPLGMEELARRGVRAGEVARRTVQWRQR